MGTYSKGKWTVYEALRLELPHLLEHGYIQKGMAAYGTMSWNDQHGNKTGEIKYESRYGTIEKFFRVMYSTIDRNGNEIKYDYQIQLTEIPSNIGKGTVLYFVCPVTKQRCRILYKAYGNGKFISRVAYEKVYQQRLYYDCQIASKLWKYCENFWRIDKKLEKMRKKTSAGRRVYRGRLTKRSVRYNRQQAKQILMDKLRFTEGVPKSLRGVLPAGGI